MRSDKCFYIYTYIIYVAVYMCGCLNMRPFVYMSFCICRSLYVRDKLYMRGILFRRFTFLQATSKSYNLITVRVCLGHLQTFAFCLFNFKSYPAIRSDGVLIKEIIIKFVRRHTLGRCVYPKPTINYSWIRMVCKAAWDASRYRLGEVTGRFPLWILPSLGRWSQNKKF